MYNACFIIRVIGIIYTNELIGMDYANIYYSI